MRPQKQQQKDGRFRVVDLDAKGKAATLAANIETEAEADVQVEEFKEDEGMDELEAANLEKKGEATSPEVGEGQEEEALAGGITGGTDPDGVSEHNPFGLSAHERIAAIHKTLAKHGMYIAESAHPAQHPLTVDSNYVKPQHS